MSIYKLKSQFQKILRPVVRLLVFLKITANQVTVFTCILSIMMGLLIAIYPGSKKILLSLPFFLFIRMALNAIDGLIAKEHNMQTKLGAILNELTDVIADSAIYLSFCFISFINPIPIVLLTVLSIISEMAGVIAIQIGASRRYDGPMGKSDRAFIFALLAIFLALELNIYQYYNYILIGVNILLVFTIINRSRNALKEAKIK